MNLNCQKSHDKLVHLLNDELHPSEYISLENHLSECNLCQIEYEQLNDTISTLRSIPPVPPPADLALSIRRKLEEQQDTIQAAPLFDLITLIFSKITATLKLGPRPVHINYAALFCYLILAAFLIKLTFWAGNDSPPQNVIPNQSSNYVAVNPVSTTPKSSRSDITWAQVKMVGLRTSLDLSNDEKQFSNKPPVLKPIGSQVLHGGSWYE